MFTRFLGCTDSCTQSQMDNGGGVIMRCALYMYFNVNQVQENRPVSS